MVNFKKFDIPGVKLIELTRHTDHRGWLSEVWRDEWNIELGTNIKLVQDTWAFSDKKYTLRGLHAFKKHVDQHKLIMVMQGAIFDVVADGREDSPTYGKYISVELSANNPCVLLVPPNCYHGYLTLTENTIMGYKVDQYFSKDIDIGVHWQDPTFNIKWPLNGNNPFLSDKDRNLGNL